MLKYNSVHLSELSSVRYLTRVWLIFHNTKAYVHCCRLLFHTYCIKSFPLCPFYVNGHLYQKISGAVFEIEHILHRYLVLTRYIAWKIWIFQKVLNQHHHKCSILHNFLQLYCSVYLVDYDIDLKPLFYFCWQWYSGNYFLGEVFWKVESLYISRNFRFVYRNHHILKS